ncbi:glycosyl transferase [Dictyobacter alpinus]|uniref:Glycosyl transferase n=1 Tax=Dictyobacter alpinus TaxID=2014873 RepID=A0A402BGK3_9CHLR|nr:glycosyltransferase [Dictyobacter alpinus]GCE30466.1 glycosyl transferase [Dictyobacter alpinus]
MTIKVSVVVPTYERPDFLERCLRALLSLDYAPADYEIIIVDDAHSAETRQQVEDCAQQALVDGHRVRYLALTGTAHGPAAARNAGWRQAQADIIAFTDDDCIPELNWLKAGAAAFVDDIAAASGKIVVPLQHEYTDYEYSVSLLSQAEFVTANCFYRRSALQLVGGFDQRFKTACCEDSDLYFTCLEQNLLCVKVPEAIILHPVRLTRWGSSLRQQQKSMYDALLFKKHPVLYRQRIQTKPPWNFYCILGVLLLILLGVVAKLWLLAGIALCAWIYMTARFCIQRLQKTSRKPGHVFEMIITSALIPPLSLFWRWCGMCKFRTFFL